MGMDVDALRTELLRVSMALQHVEQAARDWLWQANELRQAVRATGGDEGLELALGEAFTRWQEADARLAVLRRQKASIESMLDQARAS
jgi:endo-1,4-beta-D-glucanase Y